MGAGLRAARYGGARCRAELEIAAGQPPPSSSSALLPLIAAYQRFYEVEDIDEERNRAFFRRFLAPSEDGLLLGAWRRGRAGRLRLPLLALHLARAGRDGADERPLRRSGSRGAGIGRALIEASADVARERGAAHLEWATAPDNSTAQRLYDATGAERSTWISYELEP